MGDFILRYQGIEQITGYVIKSIFSGPVDNSDKRHLSSPKNLVYTEPESGLFFPFHPMLFHKGKNACLLYSA